MFFYSKPLALMGFKGGLTSDSAVNAVSSPTSLTLLQSFHRFDKLFLSRWRERKGSCMKLRSYGLPPLGSSKLLPSSNFFLLKQFSSSLKTEALYTKDVESSLKSMSDIDTSKVRRTFAYRHTLLRPPVRAQVVGSRGLHSSSMHLGKSKSDSGKDCKPTKEICRSKKDICADTESCKQRDVECYPEKVKCEIKKAHREEMKEEKQVCPKSCVRGGKCIIATSKKPAKMVYGSTECPPPKLISPRTCPRSESNESRDEPVCHEKVATRKLRKDVCVPPPLPGPPTDPVPLCPCPPPPKLHPGPCPCPEYKDEIKIKPSPPCPVKDKYPCCLPIYYCPPKEPCVRKLPCEQTKKTKS